jgi:hypothetical protein
MSCFSIPLLLIGGVLLLLTLMRWFDQTSEAVRMGWWNKTVLLVVFPFAAWFFPSKVVAGRPTPVPRHEPVRGFGSVGKAKPAPLPEAVNPVPQAPAAANSDDVPPPGTPAEFLIKPQVPPKRVKSGPAIDPDKIAKLRQKMMEQGMLGEDEGNAKPGS